MEKVKSLTGNIEDDEFEDEYIYEDIPDDMKPFWKMVKKSTMEPSDFSVTADEKPDWLDIQKFRKGQKFAEENFFSICYMVVHTLLMMFTDHVGRMTFLYARSFLPAAKAHKQIFTVASAVKSWITSDIWNDDNSAARRRMSRANKLHEHYYRQLFSMPEEKIAERISLKDIDKSDLILHKTINEDFKNCFPTSSAYSYFKSRDSDVTVSQAAVTFTLFGLAGLVVTYPKYYGFHNATEEDLEAYAHMWKGLGYLLGIKDEFNFANGDLNTIRRRTKSIIEHWMRPAFREVGESWEYQARNFVGGLALLLRVGPFITFEAVILDLMNFLGVDSRLTKKSVSYWDYFVFLLTRFVSFLPIFPRFRMILNKLVNSTLNKTEKKYKI